MAVTTSKTRRWEMTERDDIELAALVKHFELFNRTEGKSPRTIVWYNMVLRQFQRFLLETGKSSRLRDIHELEVREFIIYLQAKRRWVGNPHVPSTDTRLAPMSIQDYVRALRVFFNGLSDGGPGLCHQGVSSSTPVWLRGIRTSV
jgi:site-specific recombinase XerD